MYQILYYLKWFWKIKDFFPSNNERRSRAAFLLPSNSVHRGDGRLVLLQHNI